MKNNQPRRYTESGFAMPQHSLSDVEYEQAMRALVIVCTDVCIIDSSEKKIYLAFRRARPASGWWYIGGRAFAGETEIESILGCFHRETGMEIAAERFQFISMNRYQWKDRAQEPINVGCDSLCYTYALELSGEERLKVAKSLDKEEYTHEIGLRGFTRAELISENVLPQIIDFYDKVFV